MDRQPAAGHHRHRRLVVSLLALALGATLGVAAPQALAGSGDPPPSGLPKITLDVSPASSSPNQAIKVTGKVWPVEYVGKFVTLSIQKKSRKGKWTAVSSARVQVLFTPPAEWMGKFNMKVTSAHWNAGMGDWQGQVLYGSPIVDLVDHSVRYSLTSALGTYTASGSEGAMSYTYTGYPYGDSALPADRGGLMWWFAESPADIPADSYEGDAQHNVEGSLVMTVVGGGSWETYAIRSIACYLWWTELGARPLLPGDGHMRGAVTRPHATLVAPDQTESLDWDLTPPSDSVAVLPYIDRFGEYSWDYTATKKGLYRMRAYVNQVRSPWRSFAVR